MTDIIKLIDQAVCKAAEAKPRRTYLGASEIGVRCTRAVWYSFRWARRVKHTGRMNRLFERGHREEASLVSYLRAAGFQVEDLDPATGKQWEFRDGVLGGHADGKISGPGLSGQGLVEFKTHNDKSFTLLQSKGVLSAKPEHWVQMQIYMYYFALPWALYVAVNKNSDHLYTEIVPYKEEVALLYIDRAKKLVESREVPLRVSNDPSWFICKFCDYREICHKGEQPEKNCRSCIYGKASLSGDWTCAKYRQLIPADFIPKGCDQWEPGC